MSNGDTTLSSSTAVHQGDCLEWLRQSQETIDLAFLDPPFNQGRDYRFFDDTQDPEEYWGWMADILQQLRNRASDGAAAYFMHREKNAEFVLAALRNSGWTFQNLIVWQKMASAVASADRFGKQYQIIAVATNGKRPRVFNRLRIDPPLQPNWKQPRENGVYLTDVWSDIRELTSGYFAGEEPVRTKQGERFHKQQSPIALLARIILSSSVPGDTVCDPFAGTGTALVAASQLQRNAIGIEMDPVNVSCIEERLNCLRKSDDIAKYYDYYRFTENIAEIWGEFCFIKEAPMSASSNRQDGLAWPSQMPLPLSV